MKLDVMISFHRLACHVGLHSWRDDASSDRRYISSSALIAPIVMTAIKTVEQSCARCDQTREMYVRSGALMLATTPKKPLTPEVKREIQEKYSLLAG